jgi:hypothetical protein
MAQCAWWRLRSLAAAFGGAGQALAVVYPAPEESVAKVRRVVYAGTRATRARWTSRPLVRA